MMSLCGGRYCSIARRKTCTCSLRHKQWHSSQVQPSCAHVQLCLRASNVAACHSLVSAGACVNGR